MKFYKYQGAGNDFIMLNNFNNELSTINLSQKVVAFLCDRRFGIGADGLIVLEKHEKADFLMRYYNSDGCESTMCGNGGRCIAAFAKHIGVVNETALKTTFYAIDGLHEAEYFPNQKNRIKLKMTDVNQIEVGEDYCYLNTGSPHYVKFTDSADLINVEAEGKKIRYNSRFEKTGTNVNFAKVTENEIIIRTYERGVENETLACGTGAVATAIASNIYYNSNFHFYNLSAKGGNLKVSFEKIDSQQIKNIWLEGDAKFVFEGEIKENQLVELQ